MPTLPVDDITMHYEEAGSGPPLLLVHGLGSSGRDWALQVDAFRDAYRVITVDLRGHGRTSKPPGPYHIAQMARDVAVLLRRIEAVPASVVGLSMGGMVALELAAGAPRLVRRLAIVNSVPDVRLRSAGDYTFYWSRRTIAQVLGMRRTGQILAHKLFPRPEHAKRRRQFVRRWAENDRAAYLASIDAAAGWTVADRLSRIRVPTCWIAAAHDYTPVAQKRAYAACMPNATVAVIDDAHHAVPVERPAAFNAALRRFLESDREAARREPETHARPPSTAGNAGKKDRPATKPQDR